MSLRRKSSRQSALKAKELFKEIGNESDSETLPNDETSKSRKRKRTDDNDFQVDESVESVTSGHRDDGADSDLEGDSDLKADSDVDIDAESVRLTKRDSNTLTMKRKEILELWKEYFTAPESGLKEVPEKMITEWKSKLPKKPKSGKNKAVKCPNSDCSKSFTAAGGLVYHYARCGLVPSTEYKCKLCPFVSPQGVRSVIPHLVTHASELPPIPDHLKDAMVYKKTIKAPSGTDGNNKKAPSDTSGNNKKAIIRSFHDFDDYIHSTKNYRECVELPNLFPMLVPLKDEWKPKYMSMNVPQGEESVKFRIGKNYQSSESDLKPEWKTLNLFESMTSVPSGHHTFFVGGPVWSAAWVPMPTKVTFDTTENMTSSGRKGVKKPIEENQILALSAALNFDVVHPFSEPESEPGLIQFWNFGPLSTETSDNEPQFEFGIAHNYGLVWDMEWCPFGNTYQSINQWKSGKYAPKSDLNVSKTLPRLGLLALACGDGHVRIMSIPHPSSIIPSSATGGASTLKARIFSPQPVILLSPPGVGPIVNNLPGICKCLSWSRVNGCVHIAAGYGNGIIAVWNITTQSKILIVDPETSTKTDLSTKTGLAPKVTLNPTWSFLAHGSSVNSVKWSPYPNSMILASGGTLDRQITLWDFSDLSLPVRILKRAYVTNLDWIFRFSGLFAAFDDCFLSLKTSTNYIELAEEDARNTLSPHRSAVWSLSYSDWLNSEASSDSSGECLIFHDFLFKASSHSRWKNVRKEPLYRIKLVPLTNGHSSGQDVENESVRGQKSGQKIAEEKKKKEVSKSDLNVSKSDPSVASEDRLAPNNAYHSYTGISQDVGLQFIDHSLEADRLITGEQLDRLDTEKMTWVHPSHYPLASINQIKWNPNYSSYTWIFTGTQSGLCRISCCNFLTKSKKIHQEGSAGDEEAPTQEEDIEEEKDES